MKVITKLKENYNKPTPSVWKFVGESIALLGTTMTASLAGLEVHYSWIIVSAILTWVGERVTKFISIKDGEAHG